MREKGIEKGQAIDLVRLQRLIDVCDTKETTALYLLQEWNYEPQVRERSFRFLAVTMLGRVKVWIQPFESQFSMQACFVSTMSNTIFKL